MTTIVTRAGKGTPLTNTEVDTNFTNLNTDKLELGGTFSSGTANSILFLNGSKVATSGSALTFDGTNLFVGTSTNTNSSRIVSAGTISETVNSTQYLVASQFDIGTAANEIPLNQYLGNLAYQDAGSIAGQVGLLAGTTALPSLVSATDTDTGMWFPAANTLAWSTGGTQVVTVDSSGRLLIGPTSATAGGGLLQIGQVPNSTSSSIGFNNNDNAVISARYSMVFQNDSDNNIGGRSFDWKKGGKGYSDGTTLMTLDASGNLVVGTTAAAIGRATFVGGTQQLAFHDGNGSNTNFGLLNYGGTSGELTLNANSSGGNTLIRLLTSSSGANAERVRISSDGTFRVKGAGSAGTTDAVQFSGSAPANSLILDSSGVLKENGYAVVSQADIGTAPNEIPLNQYLGTMAYQDGTNYYNTGMTMGFRNRIINGAMQIDQRNAGAAVTVNNDPVYTIDRFVGYRGGSANDFTVQQSTTAPSNFKNSLLITAATGISVTSGMYSGIAQKIEGLNVVDIGFGTSSAKSVSISFWIRCSLTGTFGGYVRNGDTANRSYIFAFTINSANTWEYKTVVIPGDTTGTWATNTSAGFQVGFDLGVGSSYSNTAGSWFSSNYFGLTGGVKLAETTGATWYITGVQVEVGTQATPFDWRPYGTELQLCQRYFQTIAYFIGYITSTTDTRNAVPLSTALRATPTVTVAATLGTISNPSGTNGTPSTISNTTYQTNGTTVWFDMASSTTMTSAFAGSGCLTTAVGSLSSEL